MNEQSKQERDIQRLDQKRRAINERLEKHRLRLETQLAHINAKFDEKQAEQSGQLNRKQTQIVEAALELLKTEGLANLSLRSIAKKLDIQAPALYWHFKNKEVLVDYMAEAIMQKEFQDLQPRRDDETWQAWLTNHMVQLRKAMLAYPDGGRVVAGAHLYPAITLARSFETALVSLRSAGVELTVARRIIMTATHYTFGRVIEEQSTPSSDEMAKLDVVDLLKPFPNMREAINELFGSPTWDPTADFVAGIEYIIAGSGAN